MLLMSLLWACKPDPAPFVPPSVGPESTGDTAAPSVSDCLPTDNALRFDCPLSSPGIVRWWPVDDPSDVREATGEDSVRIWGLRPDVDTVVQFPDGAEQLQTPGPLPEDFANITALTLGEDLGSWLLTTSTCNARDLVVIDERGRPRWYATGDKKVLGFDVTPTGTVLAMRGGGAMVELDAEGTTLWTAQNDTGMPFHHDLARDANGTTFVLGATSHEVRGVDYVVDVLLVFDAAGQHVDTWELFDHLPDIYVPTDNNGYWIVAFPNAIDFSHGNSVEVSPDGSLVLSLRWLDTVLAIEGDIDAPSFGTPRWWISADDSVPSDFVLDEPFDGQHHASVDADGVLRLFDNRRLPESSRGLAYSLDNGKATLLDQWVMPKHCPIQGSIYPLDDGSVVLTCAPSGLIERHDGTGKRGSVDLSCTGGTGNVIARSIPIDW